MAEIRSNADVTGNYAGNIKDSVSEANVGYLAGVDDDNTLAESGVYNSFYSLKSSFETFKQALMVDADNLRTAAAAFKNADETVGNSLR